MSKARNSRSNRPHPSAKRSPGATPSIASQTLIPLGAMLLSGSLGAFAQEAPAVEGKTLSTVTVREKAAPKKAATACGSPSTSRPMSARPPRCRATCRCWWTVASAAAPTCSRPCPGRSAVLIGRPYLFGLADAGAHGVAHVLRLLRDELEIAMALTGCRTLADVSREGRCTRPPETSQLIANNDPFALGWGIYSSNSSLGGPGKACPPRGQREKKPSPLKCDLFSFTMVPCPAFPIT